MEPLTTEVKTRRNGNMIDSDDDVEYVETCLVSYVGKIPLEVYQLENHRVCYYEICYVLKLLSLEN